MKTQHNLTLLAWTALCSLSCFIVPTVQATDHDISITAYGFSPAYLEVTAGDRVYWWNEDYDFYDTHSTRSYSYPWSSGPISVGWGVYLDVTQTGSFDYVDDYGYSGWGTLVVKPAGPPPPTVISAPNRKDMVYDQGRDVLYITSGSTVLRYQLGAASFLTPFQLSGNLMGIDLSPDGNVLVVADASASPTNVWVHVIDLTTGQTNRAYFPIAFGETGTFAVAFGGDGAALISSRFGGSGWVPLRRYDPATGNVTVVSPSIRQDSMLSGSGDGTSIIIAESNISGGEMDLYDVASRSIKRTGGTGHFNYECAASRDGSLFALPTSYGTLVYDGNFNQVTNIGASGAKPIGVAFHPAADAVFLPFAGTPYVEAFSTTDWALLAQYDFGSTFVSPGNNAFVTGRVRLSPDGQTIFVTVSGGVGYLRHGLSLPLTHRLVVAGSPTPYGEPTPYSYGAYWLPDGTSLTLSVPPSVETNGTEFIATGWTGTGSATGTGTTTETSFTLTANTTLTWNWSPLKVGAAVQTAPAATDVTLQWPSVAGKSYDVLYATNLQTGFLPLATDIPATPPLNVYEAGAGPARAGFYRIQVR